MVRLQGSLRVASAVFVAALMAGVLPAHAWDRAPVSVFRQRRERLASRIHDGLVALYGASESDIAAATTPFRQNENFYYLTGWNRPGAKMLLVPAPPGSRSPLGKEIIFIPPRDRAEERWTGPELDPNSPDAPQATGFAVVMSASRFDAELRGALKDFGKVYTELTPEPDGGEECLVKSEAADLRALAPSAQLFDLRPIVTRMRMVKSADEIALVRKAVDASVDAQLAAMKAVHPGMWEYQAAALVKYQFENEGCEWPSYPPIVGSGPNSTVLHYDNDSRLMRDGDLVVIDAAGSYSGYASDITRTLPVNGHFTPRQLEIYNVVLGAQQAAIAAARPGLYLGAARPRSLYHIAYDYINSHGYDFNGHRLGPYFIHGLGHSVGLNVHDPFDASQPLEPGMVITIEPGVYLPEEAIGVRIEDMILITPGGAEALTRRLPKRAEEIESVMSRSQK